MKAKANEQEIELIRNCVNFDSTWSRNSAESIWARDENLLVQFSALV